MGKLFVRIPLSAVVDEATTTQSRWKKKYACPRGRLEGRSRGIAVMRLSLYGSETKDRLPIGNGYSKNMAIACSDRHYAESYASSLREILLGAQEL